MSTSVGSLFATLSLEDKEYQDALKRAPSLASQTAAKINSAFAKSPAIDNAAKTVQGLTSDLRIQASALGLSARAFENFVTVGKQSDVSAQQLVRTFAGLRGVLDLAKNGSQPVVDNFRELGLNWRSVARAKPDAALQQVARATFLAAEGSSAYNAGLRILNADTSPKFQGFLRRIAGADLPALAAAAKATGGTVRSSLGAALTGTFARFVAPAVVLGTFARLSTGALRLASDLKDTAAQAGVTFARFQTLDFVARQNGATGADFVGVLARLRTKLADAAGGSQEAQGEFEALGLDWKKLAEAAPDDALFAVARAMRVAGDGTRTFGLGADLLGVKALPKLQASLREIAERGFPALDDAALKSGEVLSTETGNRLAAAKQVIDNLGRSVTILTANFLDGAQAIATGTLDKLTATESALQRLIDLRVKLNGLTDKQANQAGSIQVGNPVLGGAVAPLATASPAEELQNARLTLARTVAAETQRLTGLEIKVAQQALQEYAAGLDQRKKLTAAATAEIKALAEKLAARQIALDQATAQSSVTAAEKSTAAAAARAEQQTAIARTTAARIAAIYADGEKKRALDAADTAGKIAATEKDLAAARGAAVTQDPAAEIEAAKKIDALESDLAALKRTQADEGKRATEQLKAQAQSLIESLSPQARYDATAAHINELYAAGLLSLDQWKKAIGGARDELGKSNIDNLVAQLKTASNLSDRLKSVGSALLEPIRNQQAIAGAAGGSNTERSIQHNLDKAQRNAARGNTGAAAENISRANELGRTVIGASVEELIARERFRGIDPNSNDARNAAGSAARSTESLDNSSGSTKKKENEQAEKDEFRTVIKKLNANLDILPGLINAVESLANSISVT